MKVWILLLAVLATASAIVRARMVPTDAPSPPVIGSISRD